MKQTPRSKVRGDGERIKAPAKGSEEMVGQRRVAGDKKKKELSKV